MVWSARRFTRRRSGRPPPPSAVIRCGEEDRYSRIEGAVFGGAADAGDRLQIADRLLGLRDALGDRVDPARHLVGRSCGDRHLGHRVDLVLEAIELGRDELGVLLRLLDVLLAQLGGGDAVVDRARGRGRRPGSPRRPSPRASCAAPSARRATYRCRPRRPPAGSARSPGPRAGGAGTPRAADRAPAGASSAVAPLASRVSPRTALAIRDISTQRARSRRNRARRSSASDFSTSSTRSRALAVLLGAHRGRAARPRLAPLLGVRLGVDRGLEPRQRRRPRQVRDLGRRHQRQRHVGVARDRGRRGGAAEQEQVPAERERLLEVAEHSGFLRRHVSLLLDSRSRGDRSSRESRAPSPGTWAAAASPSTAGPAAAPRSSFSTVPGERREDQDVIAEEDRLLDRVRDEEDRRRLLAPQRHQVVLHARPGRRIQRAERLVHQDDARLAGSACARSRRAGACRPTARAGTCPRRA